jgi:hypothetical protein
MADAERRCVPVVRPGQEEKFARAQRALHELLAEIEVECRSDVVDAVRTALIRSGVLVERGGQ